MKKKITKEKLILYIGIAFLLLPISIYGATTLYDAIQVAYDNSKSGTSKTNVQDVLDELYARSKDYCPDGYVCTNIVKTYTMKNTSTDDNFSKWIGDATSVVFTDIEVPEGVTTTNLSAYDEGKIVGWLDGTTYYVSSQTTGQKVLANTLAYSMFEHCSKLTSIDFTNFDTSNVTNMYAMFFGCNSLTTLDLSNFNTSNVTGMSAMFYGCSSLTTLDLSNLDTSSVTTMSYMFEYCRKLTSLDVSSFDTSKVTDMDGMFASCHSLTTLDLSNFDTSNVTIMGSEGGRGNGMFLGCSSLTALDISNFDTSNVTIMGGMFESCSSLTTLDISNFNTSKVTDMHDMFRSCTNLSTIYVGLKWSTENVSSSDNMFLYCTVLPNFNSSYVDKTYAYAGGDGYLTGNTSVSVIYKVTSTPKNGSYYTIGEKVTYDIIITNTGTTEISDLRSSFKSIYSATSVELLVTTNYKNENGTYRLPAGEQVIDSDYYTINGDAIDRGNGSLSAAIEYKVCDGSCRNSENVIFISSLPPTVSIEQPNPDISIEDIVIADDTIQDYVSASTFTFTVGNDYYLFAKVKNTGNTNLYNISLSFDFLTDEQNQGSYVEEKMPVDESRVLYPGGSYTVTNTDYYNSYITVNATVTAEKIDGTKITRTKSFTLTKISY